MFFSYPAYRIYGEYIYVISHLPLWLYTYHIYDVFCCVSSGNHQNLLSLFHHPCGERSRFIHKVYLTDAPELIIQHFSFHWSGGISILWTGTFKRNEKYRTSKCKNVLLLVSFGMMKESRISRHTHIYLLLYFNSVRSQLDHQVMMYWQLPSGL